MSTASPLLQLPVLQADLVRVEDALTASVVADDSFLTEVASHLILAGGKRVRPAFAITSAAITFTIHVIIDHFVNQTADVDLFCVFIQDVVDFF